MTTGQRLRLWTVCGIMDDSLIVVLWPFLALAVVRSSWIGSGASVKLSSPAKEYASELVQTWLSCPYDSPEEDIVVALVSSERCAPALLQPVS